MTMADTIAVMNKGKVEQMGAPADLYETPTTTFVANFLGQSNLVRARVTGREGGSVLLDANGHRLAMPPERAQSTEGEVWMGVRPEKIRLHRRDEPSAEQGLNRLDGVVADSSFTGMSTQYLVRMPWGQELMVFAQNLSREASLRRGDEVSLSWHPEHTFALDAHQDAHAGQDSDELEPVPSGAG